MKITKDQRTINIIAKAIKEGHELDYNNDLGTELIEAEQYLIANVEHEKEECDIESVGNHGQRVDWSDGYGYDFWSQGEIVDFRAHWADDPKTKVVHSVVVDSMGNVIDLYYKVGETDFNAPEGCWFNPKTERHEPEPTY